VHFLAFKELVKRAGFWGPSIRGVHTGVILYPGEKHFFWGLEKKFINVLIVGLENK